MDLLPVGIHLNVPESIYRADPGYNQSTLVDFMHSRTPAHFKAERDDAKEELASKDFIRIGSYVDCALTEPDELNKRFIVTPAMYPRKPTAKDPSTSKPWTRKATYCQDWEAEREEGGQVVLTPTEYSRAIGTCKALQSHDDTASALQFCSKQVVIIAEHPTFGYRLKGKLDLLAPPVAKLPYIIDIKTGESADYADFEMQCRRLCRRFQARYYLNLLHWATSGEYMHTIGFAMFVVETSPPHGIRCYTYELGTPELETIQQKINDMLRRYHECVTTGVWPCYPKDWVKMKHPEYSMRDREQPEILV